MIVAILFTTSAAVALVILTVVWRQFYLDRKASRRNSSDASSAVILATLLLVVMSAFVVADALQLVGGLGAVMRQGWLIYALALAPLVKLIAAAWILRLRGRALEAIKRERRQ